jgi:hypothetical protein
MASYPTDKIAEDETGVRNTKVPPKLDATYGRRLPGKTRDEVVEIFRRYEFRDAIGHDLLFCADFLELLELAGLA